MTITKEAIEAMRPHIEKLKRCVPINDEMGRVVTGQTEAIMALAEIFDNAEAALPFLPIAVEGKVEELHEHFKQMQEMCRDYLIPEIYVRRFPDQPNSYHTEFEMPELLLSDTQKAIVTARRDRAFIGDVIRMLDGPEQRLAEALTSSPGKDGGQEVEAALQPASTALVEALEVLIDAVGDWSRPTGANGMVPASENHPLCVAAKQGREALAAGKETVNESVV